MREFLEAIGILPRRERWYYYIKRGARGRWRWFVCRREDGTGLAAMGPPNGFPSREAARQALRRLVDDVELRSTRIPHPAAERASEERDPPSEG